MINKQINNKNALYGPISSDLCAKVINDRLIMIMRVF